jgi:hypothetical protein
MSLARFAPVGTNCAGRLGAWQLPVAVTGLGDSGALKVLVLAAIVAAILLTRLGPRGR